MEKTRENCSRRLLVARIQLFHDSLQRIASFEVPKRLRRNGQKEHLHELSCLTPKAVSEMMDNVEKLQKSALLRPLDGYEGIVDGLFALPATQALK
jgi:hypothetical protein